MQCTPPVASLLDLAAIVVEQAPVAIHWQWPVDTDCDQPASAIYDGSLLECACAMEQRNTEWSRQMDVIEAPVFNLATQVATLLEEVFVAEPLSQVWMAVVRQQQRRRHQMTLPAVFRVQLAREKRVRDRAFGVMLTGGILPLEVALRIHRLRRMMERVSARMLDTLSSRYDIGETRMPNRHPIRQVSISSMQRHWRHVAMAATVPARLLARTLRLNTPCSAVSHAVVESVQRCLPYSTTQTEHATVGAESVPSYFPHGCAPLNLPWHNSEERREPPPPLWPNRIERSV